MSKAVVEVLFGKGTDLALAKAYSLMEERGLLSVDSDFLNLMAITASTPDVVAKMTTARAIITPTAAHFWLRYLNQNVFGEAPMYEQQAPGQYVQGVVLGLFEAAVWFDKRCVGQNGFLDELPDVCVQMIVGDNELQRRADVLQFDSTYSGRLANAVKAYAKDTEAKGCRLAQVDRIIEMVTERVSEVDATEEKKVGVLGYFVLEQFNYTLFNQLSVLVQAQALSAFMATFLEIPLGGAADKQG